MAMVTVQEARAWPTLSEPTVRQVFHEKNWGLCWNRGSNGGVEFIKSFLSSDCHPLAGWFSLFDQQFPHLQSQVHNNSLQDCSRTKYSSNWELLCKQEKGGMALLLLPWISRAELFTYFFKLDLLHIFEASLFKSLETSWLKKMCTS